MAHLERLLVCHYFMRFEVPQFIEIEDKIFGPLTWRQFVYLGGGLGLATVLFFTAPLIVFVLLGLPVAGLAFALGFYPVNNQPFSRFLESVIAYTRNTKLYLWRKKNESVYQDQEGNSFSSPTYTPPEEGSNLTSLARKLEMKANQK